MLAVSCDDIDSDVLVLDPFGGAGTTAMVALQNGYRAVTIDINAAATNEARERLARHQPIFLRTTKSWISDQRWRPTDRRRLQSVIVSVARPLCQTGLAEVRLETT